MAGKKKRKKDKKAKKKAAKEAARAAKLAKKRASAVATRKKTAVTAAKRKPSPPVARKRAPVRRPKTAGARTPVARVLVDRQQPESLRLSSAGPSFTANDLQRSLAFYRDVLGFTVKERWEQDGVLQGVELVAGRVSFWLGQDDWKKGRDRVKGLGFRIYCDTSQDVDAIAERIKAAGVSLLQEPKDQPWGGRDLAVVDPDGFTITIARGLS
jgi:uncharacterized glyoxalase superfamily protein PhnB